MSRKFYDKLGDEVALELVEWLNTVEASYRQEFSELFAANFGQLRAEMAGLRAEMNLALANLRAELLVVLANQKSETYDRIAQGERRLLVWMIGLWLSAPLATAGMVLLLRRLGWF